MEDRPAGICWEESIWKRLPEKVLKSETAKGERHPGQRELCGQSTEAETALCVWVVSCRTGRVQGM